MRLNPFGRKKKRSRSAAYSSLAWLKPETKMAIIGVMMIALAVVLVFSFFNQAGRGGEALLRGVQVLVGWLSYIVPLGLLWVGYRLLRPGAEPWAWWRLVGAGLLCVGLLGTVHIISAPLSDSLQMATEGRGGGYVGFILSYPLALALSRIIVGVLFAASIMVGIFLTGNISVGEALDWLKGLVPGGAPEGDGEAEEEREEGESSDVVTKLPRFRISSLRSAQPDAKQLPLDTATADREKQQLERRKQLKAVNRRYNPPPLELLSSSSRKPEGGDVEANKDIIARTLENFNIPVEMGKARVGPTVTQYTLRPDEGVRLSQITALHNDLSRALKAHPVRIEAPIPNTDLVGIEIPNKEVALVRLRDLLSTKELKRAESPLTLSLGKDVAGEAQIAELDRMPHLLIAGATNSGKSVCIHAVLMSLLYRNSPQLLRLVLVDPKRVELTAYNGIPHLWGEAVITDTGKTLNALKWALREMDRRYKVLEESGSRNLMSYNLGKPDEPLPYIVIVIDELADLMAKHGRDVEGPVVRLAQLARAVGIHLVLATQRPSVNVITGLIKANVPARIAFKVASQIDSRTIIDMGGAEKLVGTGDMLFLGSDNMKPLRLQGGFVSEEEVRAVVDYIIEHNSGDDYQADDSITATETTSSTGGDGAIDDPLFEEAKRIAIESGKISASFLQRRLRVGYARAARLLDTLQDQKVIGEAEGNKPREVILKNEEDTAYSDDSGTFDGPAAEAPPEDDDMAELEDPESEKQW
jgi:S-DNA-T family DNA segregation ATPase FtsK/SpoIIIE